MRQWQYVPITALVLFANVGRAASDLDYRIPALNDPADPIEVFVDLTSDSTEIATIGARLTYDSAVVTFVSLEIGGGVPAVPGSWNFIFQDTSVAGQVDFVLTDQSAAAATIAAPVAAMEVVKVTLSRIGTGCDPSAYDFNATPPDPGPPTAAFPANHYVIYIDAGSINLEAATTASASGPATDDHRYIRGNINNRSAHVLDVGDLVDLANTFFGGFVPAFVCDGAFDTNDDGSQNILDVVALVQGIFGSSGFVIPPPNATDPGPMTPGLVTVDGGSIASVLGCSEGEGCL